MELENIPEMQPTKKFFLAPVWEKLPNNFFAKMGLLFLFLVLLATPILIAQQEILGTHASQSLHGCIPAPSCVAKGTCPNLVNPKGITYCTIAGEKLPKSNPATVGLYDPIGEVFYLRGSNTSGVADKQWGFIPTDKHFLPIAGDWNGNGITEYGLYDPSTSYFHLHYDSHHPTADLSFQFGAPNLGWLPIAGDWDGDGVASVGLYDRVNGIFYLLNKNIQKPTDIQFAFGPKNSTWIPIAGDWDGDGKTTIGLFDPSTSTFYLRNSNTSGNADVVFTFGGPNINELPVAGDWAGSGTWGVGLYDQTTGTYYLKNTLSPGNADITLLYGQPGNNWLPIAGHWNTDTAFAQDVVGPLHHVLVDGQSLSVGAAGAPALTLSQPYHNLGLNNGMFVPLLESTGVETIDSGFANTIASWVPNYQLLVTNNGIPGLSYIQLKKGTASYQKGLDQIRLAKQLAGTNPYSVDGLFIIHGEADSITSPLIYQQDLLDWFTNYNTDIQAITGQTKDIPLFTDQTSSYTAYNLSVPTSALAQLAAAEQNPGKIILVGPKYFLTYNTGDPVNYPHLINTSYRELGEYYAKVYKKVVIDGQSWVPLSPKTITRSGNIITVVCNVPVAPLQIDTQLVLAKQNYGFEYTDDTNSAVITNVAITAPDTIQITLNTMPTGANPRLRYAYTGTPGSIPGAQQPGSARGNIRDSDITKGLYGDTLYNWMVHFDKPIE